jgi:hypothetical protein
MANYRSYTHLEKLGKEEVEGILTGKVSIFSKIDGTNGCIWSEDNEFCAGSRKRKLYITKDNAAFYEYMATTDDSEVTALRQYCIQNPNYIVYGEWLGIPGAKMPGSIKRYLRQGFFIFDVYNEETGRYLSYDEYYPEIHSFYQNVIPRIVELENPSIADIEKYVDSCNYNLLENDIGEGITIKNYDFKDKHGHIQIAKIVRSEFHERKSKPKKPQEDTEHAFIEEFCTNALIDKELNKILNELELDNFNNKNGKVIGMTLNAVYDSIMDEEFFDYYRKKSCVVDLGLIRKLSNNKVREFLGLI